MGEINHQFKDVEQGLKMDISFNMKALINMFPACDNMLKAASFGKHIFVQNETCDAYLSCTFLPQ